MEKFSIGYVLLAAQGALLDVVSPELRAVVVDVCKESESMYMYLYYDGEASEKLIDLWQCAVTEASAALPLRALDDGVERLDYPKKIPLRGKYAYLRKEPYVHEVRKFSETSAFITSESVDFREGGAKLASEAGPDDFDRVSTSYKSAYPVGHRRSARNSIQSLKGQFKSEWSFAFSASEKIPSFVSPVTGESHNTTCAMIHHAMDGCHIIPGRPEISKIDNFPVAYAQLAILRALLGRATPELRAIIVDVPKEEKQAFIRFYYDGHVNEELIDLWECAISETWADLGPDYILDAGVQRLDYPQKIPVRGRYAYSRYE